MKLRLSELYTSIQGEGPNVGTVSTFIRFAGCNYRCPGWPCDSPYAIDPKVYNKESRWVEPEGIMFDLQSEPSMNVTLTGGEPFLQNREAMSDLAHMLLSTGRTIDIFTNGSRPFPAWIQNDKVTVIMDWKLPGSGEAQKDLDVREVNRRNLDPKDVVKFVCKDKVDLQAATEWMHQWGPTRHQIYFGAPWQDGIPESDVARYMILNDLHEVKLNVQVHKYIWPREVRGI
jgi:7-carboxy-7-deazaguanine synthase